MTNFGYVSEINGKYATVEVSRTSACSMMHEENGAGCSGHCEGCASMLNKMSVKALNCTGAAVGDRVEIESESKGVLLFSLLVFVIPIVLLVFVYLLFSRFVGEGMAVLLGLVAFFLCFVILRLFDKKLSAHFTCNIIRILNKEE